VSIYSSHLSAEIAVVDIETNNIYVYGGDGNYSKRYFVLYDGIKSQCLLSAFSKWKLVYQVSTMMHWRLELATMKLMTSPNSGTTCSACVLLVSSLFISIFSSASLT
jgi:hypothetical protein